MLFVSKIVSSVCTKGNHSKSGTLEAEIQSIGTTNKSKTYFSTGMFCASLSAFQIALCLVRAGPMAALKGPVQWMKVVEIV
jgi:hypothetical protein